MGRSTGNKRATVTFSGKLTFDNAAQLHDTLRTALETGSLEIAFGEVEEVDLSFLQLLCSALRSAAEGSREITVAPGDIPGRVSSMVAATGMVSPAGRADDTFWAVLAGGNGHG